MMSISTAELSNVVREAIRTRENLCIIGPPGIGKTAIVGQEASGLSMRLTVAPIATMDSADARFPRIDGDRVTFLVADWLPKPEDAPTVLFLDELNRGRPDVQNAFLGLCGDERRMGSYLLPDTTSIVAAINPPETSGGVHKLIAPLADRFFFVEVKPDATHKGWQAWAVANGMPAELIAFARFRPECIYPAAVPGELITPTYRSWAAVGRVLKARHPQNIERALIEGRVGTAHALECLAFVEEFRRLAAVSIDAILMNPDTAPVPEPQAHATRYAIASALSRRMDVGNIGRVIRYLSRLPVEFATMAIQDAITRDPVLTNTPDYVTWSVAHPTI